MTTATLRSSESPVARGSPLKLKSHSNGSKIPHFTTQRTLPPRVSGPTRHLVKVKCFKILWNKRLGALLQKNSGSSGGKRKGPSVPFVRIFWWGENDEGVYLYPLNVGLPAKSSHVDNNSNSGQPQKGRNSFTYAVKCHKKQLSEYFKDMGMLQLQVLQDDQVLGVASVTGLSVLTKEPFRAVNGFFPIVAHVPLLSQQSQSDSLSQPEYMEKQIGEVHLVLEMENVSMSDVSPHERPSSRSESKATSTRLPRSVVTPKSFKKTSSSKSDDKVNFFLYYFYDF
jgi:hypothetical protein